MSRPRVPGLGYLIESSTPLSRSLLWELQRRFYDRLGGEAWSARRVPSYVTCNTFVAARYADVLEGYLEAWAAAGGLDPARPLHVVELASGSGELACHLARELRARAARGPFPGGVRPRVVMTDFTESNLRAWADLACLRPLLDEGWLDLARFDADRDGALELRRSGATLSPGAPGNPLVVLASYLLDSLPQDAFRVREGALRAGLLTLASSRPEPDLSERGVLERLRCHWEERPLELPHYGDPDLDGLLEEYARDLRDGAFLLPTSALRCVRRLIELAGGRLLLLVADKGTTTLEELRDPAPPHMAFHGGGCFSLMVDLWALARFCARRGGAARLPSRRDDSLKLCALRFGGPAAAPALEGALDELLEGFGPHDYYQLVRQAEAGEEVGPELLVSLLRLGRGDPTLVKRLGAKVEPRLGGCGEGTRARLASGLERALGLLYPPVHGEVPRVAARLLLGIDRPAEALRLCEQELAARGEAAPTLQLLGRCQRALGERAAARASFARAAALDPTDACSRAWRDELLAEEAGPALT